MQKILYLTATNWWWAKQRPQFIAEGLSDFYKITYVFPKTYRTSNIVKYPEVKNPNLELCQFIKLPLDRFGVIKFVNKLLFILQLRSMIPLYDIIWITHPDIYRQIDSELPVRSVIVYDCMDDHLEFPDVKRDKKKSSEIFSNEKKLLNIADVLIFSAEYLKNKVMTRYESEKQCSVINNAVSKEFLNREDDERYSFSGIDDYEGHIKLVYTGTISAWFDFELVLRSLEKFKNIVYILAGPSEINIPLNSRIRYSGPLSHKSIKKMYNIADAFIMPFRKEELIRSVDPVKVYEYISGCKPVIVLKYEGTDKFEDFVLRYSTPEEYFSLVGQLVEGNLKMKKSAEECDAFANANTWENRVKEIVFRLKDKCDKA
jgi:glycosyltransferase involved in cell wall biosynthesis